MKKYDVRRYAEKGEKNASRVFRYIEANPIADIRKKAEAWGMSFHTAAVAIQRLGECGILVETSERRRSRIFAYEAYLDVLRKGT